MKSILATLFLKVFLSTLLEKVSMSFRYHLFDLPEEGVQVFVENQSNENSVSSSRQCANYNYLMDYADLKRICKLKGWTVPTAGPICEFPEPLEMHV